MKPVDYQTAVMRAAARLKPELGSKVVGQIIVGSLIDEFGAVGAELWLPRLPAKDLYLTASKGPCTAALLGPQTDSGLAAYLSELFAIAEGGQAVMIDPHDSAWLQGWAPPRAVATAIVPFETGADRRGVLIYHADEPPPELIGMLTMLMALAGSRISEAHLSSELRELSRVKDESLALLDSLFSTAPIGLAFLDNTLRCVRINNVLARFDDLATVAPLNHTPSGLHGVLGQHAEALRRQVLTAGAPLTDLEVSDETPVAFGERRHWMVNYYPIRSRLGESLGVGAVVVETTERKRMEELLRERGFLEAVLQDLKDGIVACDADGKLVIVNQSIQDFYALPGQPVPPERWADYYELFLPDGTTRMTKQDVPLFRALAGEEVRDAEMVIAPTHGKRRVVVCNGQAIYNEHGRKLGAVVAMHDISERKRTEAHLTRQAQSDPLTGLPNRRTFMRRLRRALKRARSRPQSVALLFLDLDWFKAINDAHGHETGDRALVIIAERLSRLLRAGDTVARFGGDEFVILCEKLDEKQEAIALSKRIQAAIAAPLAIELRHTHVMTTTSIGIAFAREDDVVEDLLRRADAAMYRAKRSGGAGHFLAED